jgi:hypothetical protein
MSKSVEESRMSDRQNRTRDTEKGVSDSREDWKKTPLLKRLRSYEYLSLDHICCEAADRIEELEVAIREHIEWAEKQINCADLEEALEILK